MTFVTSSGDRLADRRADCAEMLLAAGDPAAAAEVMRGALDLAPDWVMGWFRLGEYCEAAGAADAATEAWLAAQRLDPLDHAGAALKLALAGRGPAIVSLPGAFVETLFDQYAGRFDASLVGSLSYRAPDRLAAAIRSRRRDFGLAIDLGCGTGLMGQHLRPLCRLLMGVDISAAMLGKAAAKQLYDRLVKADLHTFAHDGEPADLVTAADVLLYIGALDGLLARVSGMLSRGGLLAFSVERLADSGGFALQPNRRYAHSETYVRDVLSQSGLSLLSLEQGTLRQDRGAPVEGLFVLAERS